MHILRSLKRSPLGLDLYVWLVYRTFTLRAPLCLSWRQVLRQFGADPAKESRKNSVQNFRRQCLREMEKIKRAWPDLSYHMVTGGLVIEPCPPRIPPSVQLRLIGAGRDHRPAITASPSRNGKRRSPEGAPRSGARRSR